MPSRAPQESSEPDVAAAIPVVPAVQAVATPTPASHEDAPWPTLRQSPPPLEAAFTCLCEALLPYLEDNLPAYSHVIETMSLHADGNHTVAWRRVVAVMEGVLGAPLVVR